MAKIEDGVQGEAMSNSTPGSRKLFHVLMYLHQRMSQVRNVKEIIEMNQACLIVSKLRDRELGW